MRAYAAAHGDERYRTGQQLSAGERKMVSIARALDANA